ncbi:MAG: PDZ domain-containing protein, partial [Burkholderiales bacterium]|nr:PDZ domain-containing protein [Burkholderiales bacterium]
VDQLLAKGYVARGYLGAGLQPLRSPRQQGILVVGVDPDGPAARAGLLVGDVIVGAAGRPLSSIDELRGALDDSGGRLALRLARGGQALELEIEVGERPARSCH